MLVCPRFANNMKLGAIPIHRRVCQNSPRNVDLPMIHIQWDRQRGDVGVDADEGGVQFSSVRRAIVQDLYRRGKLSGVQDEVFELVYVQDFKVAIWNADFRDQNVRLKIVLQWHVPHQLAPARVQTDGPACPPVQRTP